MDKIVQAIPRIKEFINRIGSRRFSFHDIDNYLVSEKHEIPFSTKEKMIFVSFANNSTLKRTYRQRENTFESMFQLNQ